MANHRNMNNTAKNSFNHYWALFDTYEVASMFSVILLMPIIIVRTQTKWK